MDYVGLDIHKEKVYGTILDEHGSVIKEGKFGNKREEFIQFFRDIHEAKIALEATGFCHPIYDLLRDMGYNVSVAHPLKTRLIGEAKIKTDKIDSRVLAHLLRSDLLPTSYIPEKEVRNFRDIVRQRAYLVRLRTQMKNKIHAEISKRWINLDISDLFTNKGKKSLRKLHIKTVDRYLDVIESLDEPINCISEEIQSIGEKNDSIQLLMTIPGIGYYSALMILGEIGEINRFQDSHHLCAYAGLVPTTHQSGNTLYHGHITRSGSKWLRWILIQSTLIHIRHDTHLTKFFYKLAKKKGKKIAVVATANKLLRVIYQMLKNKERFRPFTLTNVHGTSN
jgi:transposase